MESNHNKHHSSKYTDITEFGEFYGTSSHTQHSELTGGRTPITTEAVEAYNGLRNFLGLKDVDLETVGQWAFDNNMTNNDQASGNDLNGVGLYYMMQGAKVGWISDDAFSPQLIADIQRTARLGEASDVMKMVAKYDHDGFAEYLAEHGLVQTFVNTLKMEPHYGGWMHGRTHGDLALPGDSGATAHDVNHLTILNDDQDEPFMNDTFEWPQWPALGVPHQDVIDYFQSMVVLGDPLGNALPSKGKPGPAYTPPKDETPAPEKKPDDKPDSKGPKDGSAELDAKLIVKNDWGEGAVLALAITNTDTIDFKKGWDVKLDLDPDLIENSWNGKWTETSDGEGIKVSDVGWNGTIEAGQTIEVGFQINEGALNEALLNQQADIIFA